MVTFCYPLHIIIGIIYKGELILNRIEIKGGCPLNGTLRIQGSKNAVLPMIAASILTKEKVTLLNCPHIYDVDIMLNLLKSIGCEVKFENHIIEINPENVNSCEILSEDAKSLRASLIFLSSLLARCKKAKIAYPGGCTIGKRPIDLHIKMLRKFGVEFADDACNSDFLNANVKSLTGTDISFAKKSVGASQNCILAAVLAKGVTRIRGIALEPEVIELCAFLRKMGAIILRTDYNEIMIKGVNKLHGVTYEVVSDRIVAGTYMIAAVATRGKIFLENVPKSHLHSVICNLSKTGADIKLYKNGIWIDAENAEKSVGYLSTDNYPGFPTDLQSQMLTAMTVANADSVIEEKIFEERFKVVSQLNKMGANITIEGNRLIIHPVNQLKAAEIKAEELRGGAALVIAGLIADGITVISGCNFIKRGYENIVEDVNKLGGCCISRE